MFPKQIWLQMLVQWKNLLYTFHSYDITSTLALWSTVERHMLTCPLTGKSDEFLSHFSESVYAHFRLFTRRLLYIYHTNYLVIVYDIIICRKNKNIYIIFLSFSWYIM